MASGEKSRKYPNDQYFYYDLFEKIGYTKSLAEKRIQIFDNAERCGNQIAKTEEIPTHIAIAGSRGEGVGLCLDSDFDILFIQRRFKCFDSCQCYIRKKSYSALFELNLENVPSGYAKLRLVALRRGATVQEALVLQNDSYFLCNNFFVSSSCYPWVGCEGLFKHESVLADFTGPARSVNIEFPNIMTLNFDHVQAIPCEYPSIVDSWCSRERRHNWPHANLIETIKALDVLVVPTGVSDSLEEGLQWRLSLTLAERALVRSFNDIQLKLFAAMKMLVKYEVKPLCENITSYIVKNIVFWVFERKQLNYTKASFIDNLQHLLHYLKFCVYWRYLPNYMIPAKNMFECKISTKEKFELKKCLNILIDEGPRALLRCPLVREMFERPRIEFQRKIVFRELMEQFILSIVAIDPVVFAVLDSILIKRLRQENRGNPVKLFEFVFKVILPLIRKTNPTGFFTHLVSMTDDEICIRLFEGIKRGYIQK